MIQVVITIGANSNVKLRGSEKDAVAICEIKQPIFRLMGTPIKPSPDIRLTYADQKVAGSSLP